MAKALPGFVEHMLDLLAPLGAVRVRAMFGGWGIYHDSRMFALIADEELYFKVDAKSEAEFEAAGSAPFIYEGKGKAVRMSYWRCPDGAVDDRDQFLAFARLGLEAAARAATAKRR